MDKYPPNKQILLQAFFILLGLIFSCNCRKDHNNDHSPAKDVIESNIGVLKYTERKMPKASNNSDSFMIHDSHDEEYVYDQSKKLKLDLFKSSKSGRSPLIVFLPPGGFVKYDKDERLTRRMCKDFARAGFHTASISYSLITSLSLKDRNKGLSYVRAKIGDAICEVTDAIQFIKQMNHPEIDTSNIFLAGFSAGGILALHSVFTDNSELNKYINSDSYKVSYRRPQIKGCIGIGGALLADHIDDYDNKNIPVLLFHGEDDETVPIGYGQPFEKFVKDAKIDMAGVNYNISVKDNKGNEYNADGFNTSFFIPKWIFEIALNATTSKVYGSYTLYDEVKDNIELYKVEKGKHVFMVNEKGELNQTYSQMRNKIFHFVNKHSKS